MTIISYFVIFSAVVFEVLGQLCLKRAAVSEPVARSERSIRVFWHSVARSRWTYAGIGAYAIELCLWIAALYFAPLSQAFPLMSLTYCGVAVASRLFLKERISTRSAAGVALITLGAIFVASSGA
jgi:drug/metabolite transporter (DMT)-like permease